MQTAYTCWNNDERIPIFEEGQSSRYTVDEAVRILLDNQTRKCSKQPLKVRNNSSFIIDLKWFADWEDIKADMNGVYNGVLRCGVWTIEVKDGAISVLARKKLPLMSPSTQYHLVINSKRNKAQPSLVRSIFLLQKENGTFVGDICLLQYHLISGSKQVDFEVQKHGNCRKSHPCPFNPMKKSSLQLIKENVATNPSRGVYDSLRKNAGGISGAISACDLPRGKHQIYNAKSMAQQEECRDDVGDLLKYARDKEDLVLHHSDFPEDLWVLGTTAMCRELVRSTTSELMSHPFNVDPTFSLGKFEVTSVVFKNLLLVSKRTNESPIFLGPTMIHHNKSSAAYQTMASTCVRKCNGLTDAKGFVTDGEEALQHAFEDQLKKSQSLRCFKHFENNCKDKLRKLGIRQEKNQRYFLGKTFGIKGKEEGILDATDDKDLKRRLKSAKDDIEKQERVVLGKDDKYLPKYWSYLNTKRRMIRRHMVDEARKKAGMINGENGKPPRCYTNYSESMNNVMKSAKNDFLKKKGSVASSTLSKLEFTRHVFEGIHDHQMEELKSAVAGISDEYRLADYSLHLQVPPDVWFEWSTEMRNSYIDNIQKLSMDEIFQQKEVPWPNLEEDVNGNRPEFKQLQLDLARTLTDQFGYSQDNAVAVKREVLNLVNHPTAIQPKASLTTVGNAKFEVASQSAKNGSVLVTVYGDHVTCVCGRYRHDHVCKHSLAVAARQSLLPAHFDFLRKKIKKGKGLTALAEHDVNKNTAGKKGSRNKNSYRPERGSSGDGKTNQGGQLFTEIHHNDNNFVLMFLPKEAKQCKSCDLSFCHRVKVIPFNLVFAHKERWFYPVDGDWSNRRASNKETTRYYHTRRNCIVKRFPYFGWEYVEIPQDVLDVLTESHKKYIKNEFSEATF